MSLSLLLMSFVKKFTEFRIMERNLLRMMTFTYVNLLRKMFQHLNEIFDGKFTFGNTQSCEDILGFTL
jgi:hypothetical protein